MLDVTALVLDTLLGNSGDFLLHESQNNFEQHLHLHTGVVSFSSRLVAGMRAFESMEADALFRDPLAKVLAGKSGMEGAKMTMKVCCHLLPGTKCSMQF